MRDLNRYVTNVYAADWKDIGLELGLQLYTLNNIQKNNHSIVEECLKDVLDKWLTLTPNATWGTLEIALTNVKRQQLGLDPVDDVHKVSSKISLLYVMSISSFLDSNMNSHANRDGQINADLHFVLLK